MKDEITKIAAALAQNVAETSDFDLNPHVKITRTAPLRPAAVLLAIWQGADSAQLILTKRASHLAHHPGQIAFPGGKQEPRDTGPIAAALREAQEEIGLSAQNVQVMGLLPAHETVTGFSMQPVVGLMQRSQSFTPDPSEVAEVFTVPLGFATNLRNFRIEQRRWQGQNRYFYTVPYGPYYIWGATARVLYGLAQRLQK